eukprot:742509-Amphidinium_carterae.1
MTKLPTSSVLVLWDRIRPMWASSVGWAVLLGVCISTVCSCTARVHPRLTRDLDGNVTPCSTRSSRTFLSTDPGQLSKHVEGDKTVAAARALNSHSKRNEPLFMDDTFGQHYLIWELVQQASQATTVAAGMWIQQV